MINQYGVLEQFREALAERLRGRGDFSGVQIFTRKKGNLTSTVETTVGSIGLCIVITIASGKVRQTSGARVEWFPARYWIDILQLVIVHDPKGDKPGAWAYAEAVIAALNNAKVGDALAQIPDEEIEEINPRPDQNPDLLIVRVPVTTRLAGLNRTTTD